MTWTTWAPHVLALELKKAFSYRVDFWIQFVVSTATDLAVAYFLWKAMFAINQTERMEGFSFYGIVYYYLFASFTFKIVRGAERGYISAEIYDGQLTRYLLYPVSFMGYKYVTHISQQLLAGFQLLLAFAGLYFLLGRPVEQNISLTSFVAGLATCVLAGYLHFMLASCVEMVAFWQDVVWNLNVMLKFILSLLGGAVIPLAFFPAWGQTLARYTPFPYIINFPVQVFLGQISFADWLNSFAWLVAWSFVFTILVQWIWRRGTRQYSGVGI